MELRSVARLTAAVHRLGRLYRTREEALLDERRPAGVHVVPVGRGAARAREAFVVVRAADETRVAAFPTV